MSNPSPRRSGRPCDSRKYDAILSAAIKAFFNHGFSGASIEAVAAEAGVSKVTVYKHFTDKHGLFSAAVTAECEKISNTLLDDEDGGPLAERLVRFGVTLIEFLSRPELIQFERRLAAEVEHMPELGERFLEAGPRRSYRLLVNLLEKARDRGEVDIEDPTLAANMLGGMFKGMGDLERRFTTQRSQVPPEAYIRASVDLFMRSCKSGKSPA